LTVKALPPFSLQGVTSQ